MNHARPVQSRRNRSVGVLLFRQLKKEVHFEDDRFFLDTIKRVSDRFYAARPELPPFKVVIPWLSERTAFTAPGEYIYFSRSLLERCPKDEHVAFVLGHEMAHHILGHVSLFEGWMDRIADVPGADLFPLVFTVLERRLYGPERECDADRLSLDLCREAGFQPSVCLEIFEILESFALDAGDIDIVHGPDANSDDELSPDANWKTKTRIWWWQRTRGYLPIRDRRQMLASHLKTRALPSPAITSPPPSESRAQVPAPRAP